MLPDGIRRLFRLGRGAKDVASDVDAELAHHFAAAVEECVARGMTAEAAHAEVTRRFGNVTDVRRELLTSSRRRAGVETRAWWWEGVLYDLRLALRAVLRAPLLALSVVLMLGLGIGAASTMFAVLDRMFLRAPAHVADPGRVGLVYIHVWNAGPHAIVSRPFMTHREFSDLTAALSASIQSGIFAQFGERVVGGTDDVRARAGVASADFFNVLGVRPMLGRFFSPADDDGHESPTVVLGHGFWRRHYGADSGVLGRALTIGGVTLIVVGVTPPGFSGVVPERVDVWLPPATLDRLIGSTASASWRDSFHSFRVVIRWPAEGQPLRVAAALQAAYRRTAHTRMGGDTTARVSVESILPGRAPGSPSQRLQLAIVIAAVAGILCLITVANVTNLLLLRATTRGRESAIRLALGVGRWRLVRTVVLESGLLAIAGAVTAAVFASLGGEVLRSLIFAVDWEAPLVDGRVFAFTAALGLAIGLGTGLIPGWQASQPEGIAALKAGAQSSGRTPLRSSLLAVQAALTVVLLVAFGLFGRSFLKATTLDFGMSVDRLLVAHLWSYEDTLRIQRGRVATDAAMMSDRLRAVPGVRAVSQASMAPFLGHSYYSLRAEGVDTIHFDRSGPFARLIDEEYVRVTGLRVLQGRDLTADDVRANAPVALVSAVMAAAYWPPGQALGRCLYVGRTLAVVSGRVVKSEPGADLCRTIVGVVSDYRAGIVLYAPHEKHFYLPLGALPHQPVAQRSVLALTTVDPARLVTEARAIARTVWPDMRSNFVVPLRETLGPQLRPYQRGAALLAVFGGLGVILAFGGVFSVVAYGVTQRRHELGIRVALGAAARHIVRTVVRQAGAAVSVGLFIGVAIAFLAGRLVGPLLFELSPRDPIAFGGAGCVLLIIALLACVAPIRTALRIAPTEVLKAE